MGSNLSRKPWNKGKLVGQKPPLKPKDVWAIRIHLQNGHAVRNLALFNLAIDSKLRGCDLVNLYARAKRSRGRATGCWRCGRLALLALRSSRPRAAGRGPRQI
ncbi:hypothetical protein BSFA1_86440 (plasmid) [Burkholderia sp. SFA1]|nr:hypothetical protein BSFA1_86440 [Burkholderia sp. SFA1]